MPIAVIKLIFHPLGDPFSACQQHELSAMNFVCSETMKMTKTCFIILSVLACSKIFELFSIGEVVSCSKISPKSIKCSARISILYLQTANTLEVKSIKCSHNKQYMSSWKCEAKSLNRTMKVLNLYGTLIKRISDPEVSANVESMDNTV